VTFRGVMAAIEAGAHDLDTLDDLARASLAEGEEQVALELLVPAAERFREAVLWQWCGLLQRSLDEHQAAIDSFARAAALAPNDAQIAHGQARVALEAGVDAVDLFLRARRLAPTDGAVALGLAAARNAIGEGERAADELGALVDRGPAWTAGHEHLAQLRSIIGQKDRATESLERALARFPQEEGLWSTLFRIDVQREDYSALQRDIARAESAGVRPRSLTQHRAMVAAQLSDQAFPDDLFNVEEPELVDQLAIWRIRHLIRVGAMDEALMLIDRELASERAWSIWPYASIAWRLAGDERSEWLEGDTRLIQVFDLTATLPALEELADVLRALHVAKGEYVDQSVRGGTQTDGPLLCRIDPTIRALRNAIVDAVRSYIDQLPDLDPRHPLLSQRRDRRIRFSGSWSVRLQGGGRHANHVHPQGWISSALYISLPPKSSAERKDAGSFTLGEPDDQLRIQLPPWRKIEPKAGHLVLFPSWMWHGTVPFSEGERLTVAFDVRPPI
jgi:tetratricopeptide (TPR) repeat protein